MPSCHEVSLRAQDYLDHALPWRARLGVRVHLMICDACRRYLGQLRRTIALLRGRPAGRPDPAVEARVLEALRHDH